MKTRIGFVSNSSSCSFIVGLQSSRDIDEFKKLFNTLKDNNVKMEIYGTAEDADCHSEGTILDDLELSRRGTALVPGCYVLCDSGEDHYYGYEQRYDSMCDVFDNSSYAFKFFEDSWAHMTRGNKLPRR